MSIIDAKYRDKYKGKEKNWFDTFLDDQVKKPVKKTKVTKDKDGNETSEEVTLKPTVTDTEALFKIAENNGIDVTNMRAQAGQKNAAGRIRMTIGNQLRAAAKRRHGLHDVNGTWHDADEAFLAGAARTEERDGTKVPKPPKPAKEEAAPAVA